MIAVDRMPMNRKTMMTTLCTPHPQQQSPCYNRFSTQLPPHHLQQEKQQIDCSIYQNEKDSGEESLLDDDAHVDVLLVLHRPTETDVLRLEEPFCFRHDPFSAMGRTRRQLATDRKPPPLLSHAALKMYLPKPKQRVTAKKEEEEELYEQVKEAWCCGVADEAMRLSVCSLVPEVRRVVPHTDKKDFASCRSMYEEILTQIKTGEGWRRLAAPCIFPPLPVLLTLSCLTCDGCQSSSVPRMVMQRWCEEEGKPWVEELRQLGCVAGLKQRVFRYPPAVKVADGCSIEVLQKWLTDCGHWRQNILDAMAPFVLMQTYRHCVPIARYGKDMHVWMYHELSGERCSPYF